VKGDLFASIECLPAVKVGCDILGGHLCLLQNSIKPIAFEAFWPLLACWQAMRKNLSIPMVEAMGVKPDISVENTKLLILWIRMISKNAKSTVQSFSGIPGTPKLDLQTALLVKEHSEVAW
jgi:hypothetical protein